MKNVTFLTLNGNQIDGSIPPEWGQNGAFRELTMVINLAISSISWSPWSWFLKEALALERQHYAHTVFLFMIVRILLLFFFCCPSALLAKSSPVCEIHHFLYLYLQLILEQSKNRMVGTLPNWGANGTTADGSLAKLETFYLCCQGLKGLPNTELS